jgi:trimeric autotransporter adhesin
MRPIRSAVLLCLAMSVLPACEDDAGPAGSRDGPVDVVSAPDAFDSPGDSPVAVETGDGGAAEAGDGEATEAGDMGLAAEVAPDGPPIATIVVTPANASAPPGGSLQMRAVAVHLDGSTSDVTSQATWASSRLAVATVSASGLVSARTPGNTDISATHQGVDGSTQFTVTTVATVGITIAPASATIGHGETRSFTASLAFADNTSQDVTESVQWSVDDPAIASVSNQSGQRGQVTALAAGQTTLRAMGIGHTGTATLTVTGH